MPHPLLRPVQFHRYRRWVHHWVIMPDPFDVGAIPRRGGFGHHNPVRRRSLLPHPTQSNSKHKSLTYPPCRFAISADFKPGVWHCQRPVAGLTRAKKLPSNGGPYLPRLLGPRGSFPRTSFNVVRCVVKAREKDRAQPFCLGHRPGRPGVSGAMVDIGLGPTKGLNVSLSSSGNRHPVVSRQMPTIAPGS